VASRRGRRRQPSTLSDRATRVRLAALDAEFFRRLEQDAAARVARGGSWFDRYLAEQGLAEQLENEQPPAQPST
jgi:hypothetical protein